MGVHILPNNTSTNMMMFRAVSYESFCFKHPFYTKYIWQRTILYHRGIVIFKVYYLDKLTRWGNSHMIQGWPPLIPHGDLLLWSLNINKDGLLCSMGWGFMQCESGPLNNSESFELVQSWLSISWISVTGMCAWLLLHILKGYFECWSTMAIFGILSTLN